MTNFVFVLSHCCHTSVIIIVYLCSDFKNKAMDQDKTKRIMRIYNGLRVLVILLFLALIVYGVLKLNSII